jgi:phosphoribosylformylglycinamidine synthase PurS subunit
MSFFAVCLIEDHEPEKGSAHCNSEGQAFAALSWSRVSGLKSRVFNSELETRDTGLVIARRFKARLTADGERDGLSRLAMRAKIYVSLKPGVLDPQGKAIERSLHTLGYSEVRDVRAGKYLELEVEASSKEAAEVRVREMCDKLLANPVIEDYRFEIAG